MIACFDTSAFVPLVLQEPGSSHAYAIWNRASRAVGSALLHPEASAALGRAHRTGRIDERGREVAGRYLDRLMSQIELVGLDRGMAARAAVLATAAPLKGADAVHLAVAEALADTDVTLVAGDTQLCAAARRLGLSVAEIRPGP